jgi:putative DNA primase/helicase
MSLVGDKDWNSALHLDPELDDEASGSRPDAESVSHEEARFRAVHVSELITREFPERLMLLDPWLPERSLAMVYGARGIGKSFLSLSVAIAVASQRSFLGWQGVGKRSVLYVDGEMAADQLQERVKELAGGDPSGLPLHFMARDWYEQGMPPLNDPKLRNAIEAEAVKHDVKLIVLDNLSTLWRGAENEAEAWDGMQDWMFTLRHTGHSVLLVHHAGKNGCQRGTSRKEDSLDVVMRLGKAASDDATLGAAFNIEFEKTRSRLGEGARSFYARLRETRALGLGAWDRNTVKIDSEFDQIVAGIKAGRSQKDLAAMLGVHASTISRGIKKARELGLLDETGAGHAPEEDGSD